LAIKFAGFFTPGHRANRAYTELYQPVHGKGAAMYSETRKQLSAEVSEIVHDRLQQAASAIGATIDQFIILAALEKAEKLLTDIAVTQLTARESRHLLEQLAAPRPRNKAFRQLMKDYQQGKRDGSDSIVEWPPQPERL
jgi:uncharacterized protein (DUF1778 family)